MLPGLEESRYTTFHHGLLLLKRCHTLLVLCKAWQCRGIAAFFFFLFLFARPPGAVQVRAAVLLSACQLKKLVSKENAMLFKCYV